jgi:hypothetical protein
MRPLISARALHLTSYLLPIRDLSHCLASSTVLFRFSPMILSSSSSTSRICRLQVEDALEPRWKLGQNVQFGSRAMFGGRDPLDVEYRKSHWSNTFLVRWKPDEAQVKLSRMSLNSDPFRYLGARQHRRQHGRLNWVYQASQFLLSASVCSLASTKRITS